MERCKKTCEIPEGNKSLVIESNLQQLPEKVMVLSDIGFARCKRTWRSASEGVVTLRKRCIKTVRHRRRWHFRLESRSFYGIVNAAAMGLGMKGLMEDLGVKVEVLVKTDWISAKSIPPRARGEFDA